MRKTLSLSLSLALALAAALTPLPVLAAAPTPDERRVPEIDELARFPTLGAVALSPDGSRVVYGVTRADFEKDAFVTQLFLAKADAPAGSAVQLTRGDKSSTAPAWSPDGRWIAFLSSRAGDKNQVFALRADGGEAVQLTKSETAVNAFEWSPDGKQIAFTAAAAEDKEQKARKDHYGAYEVVRGDYAFVQLFTFEVAEALKAPVAGTARTKGRERSVASFSWAPDGTRIAFAATRNPDLVQGHTSDLYVLDLKDEAVKPVVTWPGPDTSPAWSPDGRQIAFETTMGREVTWAANTRIAVVDAAGGSPRSLTDAFDEDPNLLAWDAAGLWFTAAQRTAYHLFRVDLTSGRVARASEPADRIGFGYSLSKDAKRVAFVSGSPTAVPEVHVSALAPFAPRALTTVGEEAKGFRLGSRELVRWKSQDGEEIEGVLIKPADFDPKKKYALVTIIHGGPTGTDRPILLQPDLRYYPSDLFAAKGALVLKVNYRGSAGYGERFRRLNEKNLGVGDAWDVLSGIDHLVQQGFVDENRLGSMGWSQGGYISAFLTTSTTRFKAISVGAGISNWATYYYNTDITPFTIHYLGDDPADDPEVYRKTSPMSYVKGAKTPTLIQHGENDRRVPIANAYELRQGLEDRGVPVAMIVYKGFGHGITKPKSMRAVIRHNLDFFDHHLFGGAAPDFAAPSLPEKPEKAEKAEKAAEPAARP